MLSVRDQRRGRSKSPGGRERSTLRDHRDHSRDTRAKTSSRKESKKSSKRQSDSESEGSDHDSDERNSRSKKSSRQYRESDSEEWDRNRTKSTSKKYYDSESDGQRKSHKGENGASRRHDPEESESDHRREKSKKTSKKYYESDSSEDAPRHPRNHAPDPPAQKSREEPAHFQDGRHPSYAQPSQFMYADPAQYMQTGPGPPPHTRHMSDVDPRHEQWRGQWAAVPESERPGFVPLPAAIQNSQPYPPPSAPPMPQPYSPPAAPPTSAPYSAPGAFPTWPHTDVPDHQRIHSISSPSATGYIQPAPYQYAQVDPIIKYRSKQEKTYVQNPQQNHDMPQYQQTPYPQYVEIKPGTGNDERQGKKYRHEDRPSKKELAARLGQLSLGVGAGAGAGLLASPNHGEDGRPPGSPLLEAYRGTYQSISPMPSPMMQARDWKEESDLSDLSDLDLSSKKLKTKKPDKSKEKDVETSKKHRPSTSGPEIATVTLQTRTPKRVSFYDPVPDAVKIASALSGTHHPPQTRALINILPSLTTDEILLLRAEYKNHAKASGKGINMAKHIKMRVPGNLGKVAYATALGRWESEAYWSNSWYQSGGSRRELLIESLMGRTNSDIREIKNCFKDKRYSDDLEKCMRAELKADKFRLAILLALEEQRMSDSATLDEVLIGHDVEDLYRALTARDGGETAMIHIIVLRSDEHLREVLHEFERRYKMNFPRQMIAKSRNLVGETLAHILNGALNRPMRDALLLHQAMAETAPGKERAELLISRAVRLHWEPKHMERVARVYKERYGMSVGEALSREVWSGMKTVEGREWVEFVAGCLGVGLNTYGSGGGGRGAGHGHGNRQEDRRRSSGGRELERERERDRRRLSGGRELERERERDRDRDTDRDRARARAREVDYDVEERVPRGMK